MGLNTPWCPRCGAWRGYIAPLCKGCAKIDSECAADGPLSAEEEVARRKKLAEKVHERFVAISEMRTDREAFTQALEEMVEKNVDMLKSVCYDWMRMRPESRRVRFASMYALELVQVARSLVEELGAVSLELTKFTENKPEHDERMQRVTHAMQVIESFVSPSSEPAPPPPAEDMPPGAATEEEA